MVEGISGKGRPIRPGGILRTTGAPKTAEIEDPIDRFGSIPTSNLKLELHRASSWSGVLDALERRARAGELSAILLDVDNVLVRPRGFLGSEAQEWASTEAHVAELTGLRSGLGFLPEGTLALAKLEARSQVLARRDLDEPRMIENRFFESLLDTTELQRLLALRDRFGVRLIGATARPDRLAERTRAILSAAKAPSLDALIHTGGSGSKKAERVVEELQRMGIDPAAALLVDDLEKNTTSAARLGLPAIQLALDDPNLASRTADDHLLLLEQEPERGARFELALNALLLAPSDARVRQALERLLAPEVLEELDRAATGLPLLPRRGGATIAHPPPNASFAVRAAASLAGPVRDVPGLFEARRLAEDHATLPGGAVRDGDRARQLGSIVGVGRDALLDRIAQLLLALDGRVHAEDLDTALASALSEEASRGALHATSVSPALVHALLRAERAAIVERMRPLLAARREADLSLLLDALDAQKPFSLEEIRRGLAASRPHLTRGYLEALRSELAPHLNGATDRLGEEPNLLLAAHVAAAILRAPVGTALDDILRKLKAELPGLEVDWGGPFGAREVALLAKAYDFVPRVRGGKRRKGDPSWEELPAAVRERLDALTEIPIHAEMLSAFHSTSRPPLLEGARIALVDHALADKFPFYRDLILSEGLVPEDVHVIWKGSSADPLVLDLMERCLGIRGEVSSGDADLEARTKARVRSLVEEGGDRPLFVHLMGVKAWRWLDGLAREHPNVPIQGVSHTTSDADEIRSGPPLSNLSVSVMADARAKIRYERFMFSRSFRGILEALPADFEERIPRIDSRRMVVFGAAGKIIGSGLVDALLALRKDGRSELYPRVTLVDPGFADPELAARRAELEAAGFEVVAGKSAPDHVYEDELFVVNATAEDVWFEEDYAKLARDDVVLMNLGTGQRGFSMRAVAERSVAEREPFGPEGRHSSYAYRVEVDGAAGKKALDVYALGDSYPYNLTTRHPNPTYLSEFNNLLILLGLHDAGRKRASKERGASVLDLSRVGFTEGPSRPVLFLRGPESDPNAPWSAAAEASFGDDAHWPGGKKPLVFVDNTMQSWSSSYSPRSRHRSSIREAKLFPIDHRRGREYSLAHLTPSQVQIATEFANYLYFSRANSFYSNRREGFIPVSSTDEKAAIAAGATTMSQLLDWVVYGDFLPAGERERIREALGVA